MTELSVEASRLDTLVDRLIEGADPVGLAVGVVRDGQLVYTHCRGPADIDQGRDVDPTTPFRIGSISKTFTAIGIMQLRDRGLLDLDDPITKHLKAFPWIDRPGSRPATIRDVMSTDVVTCGEDDDVEAAVSRMAERKVRRLPVVDTRGVLCGIIAQADIATRVHRDKTTGELVEAISEPGTVRR